MGQTHSVEVSLPQTVLVKLICGIMRVQSVFVLLFPKTRTDT